MGVYGAKTGHGYGKTTAVGFYVVSQSVSQIHKLHKKDELKFTHFVIMTDSITMGSVSVRYTIIIFMPEAGN